MEDEKRVCQYRNCGKSLEGERPNKKYCDRKCKGNENKYQSREMKSMREGYEEDMAVVNFVKMMRELNN